MSETAALTLIYDGECPLCQYAMDMYRLRQAVGTLALVDARQLAADHPYRQRIQAAGLLLDKGVVAIYQDQLYHGDAAVNLMARLGENSGWRRPIFNRLFASATIARLSYPLMKGGRRLALFIKRRGALPY